jgi:adenosine deaminase
MGDLQTLPKGHLHYHLEPCMRPGTLDELCAKYSFDRSAHSALRHPLPRQFVHFDDFSATAGAAQALIRQPEDLARLVAEMVEDARAQGVVYIEPAFGGDALW